MGPWTLRIRVLGFRAYGFRCWLGCLGFVGFSVLGRVLAFRVARFGAIWSFELFCFCLVEGPCHKHRSLRAGVSFGCESSSK